MKYLAEEINHWQIHTEASDRWVPMRPLNHKFDTWKQRIKDAWGVLTGKYDALDWEESEHDSPK